MTNLSIILPIHNESENIVSVIKQIEYTLHRKKITYEIICVENASTDNTLAVLTSIAKKNKHIIVLQSKLGWGNAVRKGLKSARGKYICYSVSDGQIDAAILSALYAINIKNPSALVKITRENRENIGRLLISRIYNMLTAIIFGLTVRDINATPKMIRSYILLSIPLQSVNVSLDLELLLFLRAKHIPIIEIPVKTFTRKSGISTTTIKTALEMLQYIINYRFKSFK